MYGPLTDETAIDWGHQQNAKANATVSHRHDGVDVEYLGAPEGLTSEMPARLEDFLLGLRLLRGLPLCYLVPDGALLPPESIRFFHVDRGWIDRVIDGVLSVANPGNAELAVDPIMLIGVRARLDKVMGQIVVSSQKADWDPASGPVTGMLIRSELARRWPDMVVKAFADRAGKTEMALLRSEPISRDLYIALFAGRPATVEVREPFTGVRFGVEPEDGAKSGPPYVVDPRQSDGKPRVGADRVVIALRGGDSRVLDLAEMRDRDDPAFRSPRMVALHLEQRPYSQTFLDDEGVPESRGSQSPLVFDGRLPLRRGRFADLRPLQKRLGEIDDRVDL